MTVFNAVLPVLTLVLGYFATFFTESRRDARAAAQAAAERAAVERTQATREAQAMSAVRDSFELDVLDRTFAELNDLSRAIAKAHGEDLEAERLGVAAYGRGQLSDQTNRDLFNANRALLRTSSMILDEEIRTRVDIARGAWMDVAGPGTRTAQDGKQAFAVASELTTGTLAKIADRMRTLYSVGTAMPEVSARYHQQRIDPWDNDAPPRNPGGAS